MTDLYQQAIVILRDKHRINIDKVNFWQCSCGSEGQWSAKTRGIADAAAQRHLLAEQRRILAELRTRQPSS